MLLHKPRSLTFGRVVANLAHHIRVTKDETQTTIDDPGSSVQIVDDIE